VRRPFTTFIGIDLGGARGKTTALARLSIPVGLAGPDAPAGSAVHAASVDEVTTRHPNGEPWVDELLVDHLARLLERSAERPGERVVIALNAPLTQPACVRCVVPACPGVEACVDPAVVWLRTEGRELLEGEAIEDRDSIAAVPARGFAERAPAAPHRRHRVRIAPYSQRACEIVLCDQELVSRDALGRATGPIAARAAHLRRRLQAIGFAEHQNLLEVSPAATVAALFGPRRARGYKRDADPWETRANIIEELRDLRFAPSSRLSREEVLRNDHCFEALLSGYTGYLWARDGWTMPGDGAAVFVTDGWIWAPPRR
jgi:hypothetical protein